MLSVVLALKLLLIVCVVADDVDYGVCIYVVVDAAIGVDP